MAVRCTRERETGACRPMIRTSEKEDLEGRSGDGDNYDYLISGFMLGGEDID